MKTETSERILAYIREKKRATPHELGRFLGISGAAVHRQLKALFQKGRLIKVGTSPKVFYILSQDLSGFVDQVQAYTHSVDFTKEQKAILDSQYLYISPFGQQHFGAEGFIRWCTKTKQPIQKTVEEYIRTVAKYNALKKNELIDGMKKFKDTFDQVYLDEIFYLDFYSIERFGKTKLGQMLLYAKQSQNKELIRKLIIEIRPQLEQCIIRHNIDAVGFIPPTVKRSVQFMTECASGLDFALPQVSLTKVSGEIAIPQKTLSKLEDRVQNAAQSIFITEKRVFQNILLIDDAVGSGATLNETARKIREEGVCTGSIIGLAITGSFKGFDVLSEV